VGRLFVILMVGLLCAATAKAGSPSRIGAAFNFDLGRASINGHVVLGKRVSTVRRALGQPNAHTLHSRSVFFRYGPRGGHVSLFFSVRNGALRVTSIVITSPEASEARTGRIVSVDPSQLQRRIKLAYAGRFRLTHPYECTHFGCRGVFRDARGRERLTFGEMDPSSARGRYVILYI